MRPLLLLAPALVAISPNPVSAETLQDAILSAYATNPELAAARAAVRQVDETLPIARSGMRPNVGGSVNFSQDLDDQLNDFGRRTVTGVRITQPVWEGGRVQAEIRAADARVGAARERLRGLENRIVADTAAAYADVLAFRAEVDLNRNQVRVLEQQLRASSDRFEVGDLTRTDVAQSQARLETARANLVVAEGNALRAEQTYLRLVGRLPGKLEPLPDIPALPPSVDEARETALVSNPELLAARYDEKATGEQVKVVQRERFGQASVNSTFAYQSINGGPLAPFQIDGLVGGIGVTASIPIMTSGLIASRVRQVQAAQSEGVELIEATSRLVVENTTNAWIVFQAAEAVIQSARVAISANALAAEGVQQENLVGSRDIIDVLNADQELLNTRVALVRAERDKYIAAYRLLQVLGVAVAAVPALDGRLYDPDVNFRRVDRKWREFGDDPNPREDRMRNRPPGAAEPAAVLPPPESIRVGPPEGRQ